MKKTILVYLLFALVGCRTPLSRVDYEEVYRTELERLSTKVELCQFERTECKKISENSRISYDSIEDNALTKVVERIRENVKTLKNDQYTILNGSIDELEQQEKCYCIHNELEGSGGVGVAVYVGEEEEVLLVLFTVTFY
ncbi:MAG: hypothetical protein ACYTKD_24380 [Planctomycetota bacterium]|jgi:hypothetical protein